MKRWQFWVGILISVVFLYVSLRGMELSKAWQALRTADYWWLIPGVAVYFVGVLVRTWRWHYLLRPLKKIPTLTMFPIVCIGYMGNNIYPARAGEVLRAAVLKRREGVPISASLATIIIERIFDGVVMLAFVFLNLAELAGLTGSSGVVETLNIRDVALWGSVIFFGALLVFLLAAMFPKVTERLVHYVIDRFVPVRLREKTRGVTLRFLSGLEALRSPQEALMIFVTTVVIWLLETGKYWFVMHAFQFQVSFLRPDADERHRQPGDHPAVRARLRGHFRRPRDCPAFSLWGPAGDRRQLYPGAARRAVVPDHCPGRLLLLTPTAALGKRSRTIENRG